MSDTNTEPRTLTDSEHAAILAAMVTKETAALNENLETLKREKAELETKLDLELASKATLEAEKAAAVKEFEDFKANLALEAEKAAKKDERLAAVKEAAAHLPEEFLADEARIARIVAMVDEDFNGYVADLKATATGVTAPQTREVASTQMSGAQVNPPTSDTVDVTSAAKLLFPTLVKEA